jgi:response regulator RpfG family c-di-GMP phosphodiesterase
MPNSDFPFELTPERIAQCKVVLVDDEPFVTTALRNLLFLELDLEAIVFNDARKASAHVRAEPVDLIVSDFLMPGMDGIEFLREARSLRPEAPRILLTGYADKENAIKAINEVQLFQYVEKPWDNAQVTSLIRSGLERHHLIRSLYAAIEQLERTERDLSRLRRGLVRAFA